MVIILKEGVVVHCCYACTKGWSKQKPCTLKGWGMQYFDNVPLKLRNVFTVKAQIYLCIVSENIHTSTTEGIFRRTPKTRKFQFSVMQTL